MLHTVSGSDINVELISQNDAVLFWLDGVILAMRENPLLKKILTKTQLCYVLDNDILARGIGHLIDKNVQVIDMNEVVKLTERYHPQMKW